MNKVAETSGRLSKFVAKSTDEQDTLRLIEGQKETIAMDNLELHSIFPFLHFLCQHSEIFGLRRPWWKLENSFWNKVESNFYLEKGNFHLRSFIVCKLRL